MAKNKKKVIASNKGNFEYKMTKDMADALLKGRKGTDKNKHPQEYLCNIVNPNLELKALAQECCSYNFDCL